VCGGLPSRQTRSVCVGSVAQFQQAIRAGRLKPGTPQTKHILGKMFLASFLSGVDAPSLDVAV
jgi:hypothetical protein